MCQETYGERQWHTDYVKCDSQRKGSLKDLHSSSMTRVKIRSSKHVFVFCFLFLFFENMSRLERETL